MPVFKDPTGDYWEFDPNWEDIPEIVREEYTLVAPEFISVPGQTWSEITQDQWERMPNVRQFVEAEKERTTLHETEQSIQTPKTSANIAQQVVNTNAAELEQNTNEPQRTAQQTAEQQIEEFTSQQNTNEIPDNWDRLTESEKWLYTKGLPFVASSGVGKALSDFNNTLAGKTLNNVFDALAEGAERTQGLVTLASMAAKEGKPLDISSAWKAGSLFYDVLADEDIDNFLDLFDIKSYSALADAQMKIADGMSIEQAKEEYYNDQGALALRSQILDTIGHIAIDPLNLIATEAKVPSRLLEARSAIFRTGSKAAKLAEKELQAAKLSGNVDKIAEAETALAKAQGTFNRTERFILDITGGLPTSPEDLSKWVAKGNLTLQEAAKMGIKGIVKDWKSMPWNWFKLTPEAKMQETLEAVSVQSQALLAYADNVNDVVETMRKAASGATGEELGHIIASPAGRVAQSSIVGAQKHIEDLGAAYKLTEEARMRLGDIASAAKKDVKEIVGILNKAKDGSVAMKEIAKIDALKPLIDSGKLTADTLDVMKQTFKHLPFDLDTFKAYAIMNVLDETARVGIQGLGIKSKSFWQRLASTVKDVETLAFLRVANPAYPIQNKLNNLTTMAARGVFGLTSPENIVKFFEQHRIPLPPSMLEGFGGPAELGGTKGMISEIMMRGASKQMTSATKSEGKLQQFSDFIKNIGRKGDKAAIWDTGEYAKIMESNDSARATFTGYMKYYTPAWRKAVGEFYDELSGILGKTSESYYQALASCFSHDDIDKVFSEGVQFNYEGLVDRVVDGMKLSDPNFSRQMFENVLDESTARSLFDKLQEASKTGDPMAIDRVISGAKQAMEAHLDDMIANIRDIAKGETEAYMTSQNGLERVIDTINANELGTWTAHLRQQADDVARANEIADGALRNAVWREIKTKWDKHWTRYQNWYEGVIEGIESGSRKSGYEVQGAAKYARERIANIREFNKNKNALWDSFFERKDLLDMKARDIEIANIREVITKMYRDLIESESNALKNVDVSMSMGLPEHLRPAFLKARENGRKLRKEYMQYMDDVYKNPERNWTEISKKRLEYQQKINQAERMSISAASGDPRALELLNARAEKIITEKPNVYTLANNYGIASVSNEGKFLDKKILNIINKYSGRDFSKIDDVPLRVAKEAFVEYAKKHKLLPDVVVTPERIDGLGIEELWGEMGEMLYDQIGESAKKMMREKVIRGTEEQRKALEPIINQLKGRMSDIRLQSVDMAKAWRDSALLDYSRRTRFDNFTGMIMPYSFWATHSMYNWALWSLERPFVFSTYLKMKKFNDTHVGGQPMSQRFNDNIGIPMPFWEDWLGDAYVNPLAIALPFERWEMPLEQYQRQLSSDEGRALSRLKQMLDNNEITQSQYDEAVRTKSGDLYNNVLADINASGDKYDWFDFTSMMFAPHAPLVWAYNIARGTPERIQTFMPVTRNIKALTSFFGVGPAGGLNIEAPIRRAMGLPEYDRWEDYRIERELNNLVANGEISVDEAIQAMIDKSGKIYDHAKEMAGKESAQAIVTGIFGIPLRPYPTGERKSRELYTNFQSFIKKIENLPTKERNKAIGEYLEQNEELKARFAMNKEPEERLRTYLVDSLWDRWNNMNDLNRNEAKEQLGDLFQRGFLQEQAYGAIPLDTLAMWNKQLGGENPGKIDKPVVPLTLAPAEVAEVAQSFYNYREQYFPNFYKQQDEYYSLKAGKARKNYVANNPEYAAYLKWKTDYLARNPKIAPYISDNQPQYESVSQLRQAEMTEPNLSWAEWSSIMPEEAARLFEDYRTDGQMTVTLQNYLQTMAVQMNIPYADLVKKMRESR